MNRADQAAEPSMEELLASIRLIISDTDKKGPPQKEPVYPGVPGAEPASAGNAGISHSDDVFELTDELVFPESQAASLSTSPDGRHAQPSAEEVPASQMYAASRRPTPASMAPLPTAGQTAPVRLERHKQPAPPVTRPIWSGRELPAAGAPSQLAAPRLREETVAARPQAKNWAADIQLPIPEQGPVSLFSAQAAKEPAAVEAASAGADPFGDAAGTGDAEETVAVAALAQRLARSAIGVLEASELETAKQVDFAHLDADSKAEVSERFADAIERENAPHSAGAALTGSLDSFLSEVRKQERLQSGAAPDPTFEKPAPGRGTAAEEAKSEPAKQQPETGKPSPVAGAAQLSSRLAPVNPAPAQPLAHAQFAVLAQAPVSSQSGKTLEDAVREMLRPLLVQWLNENMPRILENAIREEIAVRGLLPKSGG